MSAVARARPNPVSALASNPQPLVVGNPDATGPEPGDPSPRRQTVSPRNRGDGTPSRRHDVEPSNRVTGADPGRVGVGRSALPSGVKFTATLSADASADFSQVAIDAGRRLRRRVTKAELLGVWIAMAARPETFDALLAELERARKGD